MPARRSVLVLLAAAALISGLVTSSPSYATGPAASPAATGASRTGSPLKPARDSTPPGPVTELSMTGNSTHSISLSWTKPTDPDFAGVLIRRAVGDTPPITAADGTLVAALGKRQTAFTDKHLSAASTYSYAVFPRDKSRNVGSAATLTTATRSTSTATGLRGKLTDQQGRGISEVQVEVREVSSGNTVAGTATSSTGQFSVTGLTPGSYLLCFFPDSETVGHSATGYLPGCYRQQPYGYGTTGTPVTVLAGKMTSGLVDYLPVAGAFSGRVTDSGGQPIASVSVFTFNPDDPTYTNYGAVTRANGSYTVTGLPAGSYQVCFYSQGAAGASTTGYIDECYDDQPSYYPGTPVPVTLGHTSAGINAALATGGAVTGRVTDPSGAPVEGVFASVFGAGSGEGNSDSTGAYTISGLATGSYTLCFDGWYDISAAAPYGYTDSCAGDHWLTVYVVAGQATTVNGTVEKGGAVGGIVTGDSGPVAGVWVSVFDSSGRELNSTGTGDDGSYQFTGLAPGQVTVCFDPTYTAGGYLRTCYGAQPDGSGSSPVTVTAEKLSTADVRLRQGASITGTVTDASGAPISGVLVSADGMSSYGGYYAQTDESGSYTLAGVTADDYLICFDPSYAQGPAAGGYAAQCYDNQPSVETADPVTVGTSGSVTVNAVLSSGAAITGQLTGSDGAALSGVQIYAYSPESGQQVTASSDFDGSYRVSGLSEGDYTLCFDAVNVRQPAPTGYVNECYDNQSGFFGGTPVHVGAGTVTAGIDAELAVGAEITGRVTDSAGKPIPYALVATYGTDGSYLGVSNSADDNGRYQLTGLPAAAVAVCFQASEGGANGTGYQDECYDNQPDVSTATPVNTTAGEVSLGVDAELADAPPAG